MFLKKKISQYRRDFEGLYECEHCGHLKHDKDRDSYDDTFFHSKVIPNMKCEMCGRKADSEEQKSFPKYDEFVQI